MKKFAFLAIALMLIPSFCMAKEISTAGRVKRSSIQGIIHLYTLRGADSSTAATYGVVDGDTFAGSSSPAAYWTDIVSSSTTATYGHARESSGTYTFELSGGADIIYLYVIKDLAN